MGGLIARLSAAGFAFCYWHMVSHGRCEFLTRAGATVIALPDAEVARLRALHGRGEA